MQRKAFISVEKDSLLELSLYAQTVHALYVFVFFTWKLWFWKSMDVLALFGLGGEDINLGIRLIQLFLSLQFIKDFSTHTHTQTHKSKCFL